MKKYINLVTALIASFRPKSKIPIINSYGQSTLNKDEQQGLMEWLFASLMGAGYFGKAHLIWDDGQDREAEIFTTFVRNELIFLYRLGARPTSTVEDMFGGPLVNIRVSGRTSWRWKLKIEGDSSIADHQTTLSLGIETVENLFCAVVS